MPTKEISTSNINKLRLTCRSVESGKPVDHPGWGVSPDPDGATVGRDGEDVGGAPQGRNGHPSRIRAKGDVLEGN